MKLGPCCWGAFVTIVVLAAGVARLDRSMLTRPTPAMPGASVAAAAVLSGESLYQLESEWTNDRGEHTKLKDLSGSTQVLVRLYGGADECDAHNPGSDLAICRHRFHLQEVVRQSFLCGCNHQILQDVS